MRDLDLVTALLHSAGQRAGKRYLVLDEQDARHASIVPTAGNVGNAYRDIPKAGSTQPGEHGT